MKHARTITELFTAAAIGGAFYVAGDQMATPLPIGEYIPAVGESFSGPLYKEPHDADTLKILVGGKGVVTVRVNEIDAPEFGQPGGLTARQWLRDMAGSEILACKSTGRDRYCRTLADVRFSNGRRLADESVKAGMAWHYSEYSTSKELAELQREAQRDQRGLWAGNNPIEPAKWRRGIR